MNNIKKIIPFLLAGLMFLFLCLWMNSCSKANRFETMINQNADTLKLTRNALGQQVATTNAIDGSYKDLKKLDDSKDSTLKHLKSITDKHTISATVLSNTTSGTVNAKTDTVILTDSTGKKLVYPEYVMNDTTIKIFDKKPFIISIFNIKATEKGFKLNYKIFNKFDIVTTYARPKWYKARVPMVAVTNLNPNTETTELKNFTVAPPPNQKLFVFLAGGIVATIVNGVIVAVSRNLNPF